MYICRALFPRVHDVANTSATHHAHGCLQRMLPVTEFISFAAVGALAQLIDGALGMAYGITATSMLLGLGLPPAVASAHVHYAETFTCGASGLSHLAAGNVRRPLFLGAGHPRRDRRGTGCNGAQSRPRSMDAAGLGAVLAWRGRVPAAARRAATSRRIR